MHKQMTSEMWMEIENRILIYIYIVPNNNKNIQQ